MRPSRVDEEQRQQFEGFASEYPAAAMSVYFREVEKRLFSSMHFMMQKRYDLAAQEYEKTRKGQQLSVLEQKIFSLKEELDSKIIHLEQELWFDVKKAKTAFVPKHTKMTDRDGKILTSDMRPDRFADHFEKVQWAINADRNTTTRTTKLFGQEANIEN